jgi:type VI secretion system secreted protein Hcp
MEDVIVTSLSTGGSGGEDRLTENVTINFARVKLDYQPQNQDGAKLGGPVPYGWDIAKNITTI